MKNILIILSLVLIIYKNKISHGECKSSLSSKNKLVPALYVFGDSLVDSGNNIYLNTSARANYFPYGIDFPPGVNITGRVSNGKTLADLFSDYLGLPYAPPNYMEPKPVDWVTGYNYASGACGILPNTRNSIFLIIIGSNDYMENYFNSSSGSSTTYTPQEFADLLVNHLSNKIEKLYRLGVRKAIVSEIGALGCLPTTRISNECNMTKNEIASIYNEKLGVMVQNFTATFNDSYFTHARIFNLTYDAFLNPAKYGLKNSRNACCLLLPYVGACVPYIPPCLNRTAYYFFDGHHPTQAFYSIVANECINGSSTCLPYNLQQLIQLQTNNNYPTYKLSR